ncbi:unnamed protein product [Rotaria socialis]|uniref:Uncharacterized protein n=1 Tax=Rotaria socialis TaxID=392032 RepID=A0A820ZQ90_9BILA|nr:unnamed protein product [Rotaria socialis]
MLSVAGSVNSGDDLIEQIDVFANEIKKLKKAVKLLKTNNLKLKKQNRNLESAMIQLNKRIERIENGKKNNIISSDEDN